MTTYNTGSPLGSAAAKDLFDNAQNLDFAANDITKNNWNDRFGKNRKTLWGMEQDFSEQLVSQEQRFDRFIQNSGYQVIGDYADGPLTISEYNQIIRYDGELWKITAATEVPFTTTGNDASSWDNDSAHFLSVGDAALRQEFYREVPFVSPEMYGALDSISEADTQALIDAFAAAKAMGLSVKLSRLYSCSSNITLTTFISDIFGLGQGDTGIIFDSGFGFVVDNSAIVGTRKAMRVINTSIRTRGAKNATAFKFTGTHNAKYGEQLKFSDVLWATDETGSFGWDCCLHLDQASQVFMDHCSMSGLDSVPTNCCIRLTNQSRDINFTNGCASDFLQFMDVTSGSEGVTVAFNHIIAGQRGIVSHDTGGNMIFVIGNHFNTSISVVELGEGTGAGSNHCKISNNFCIVYNRTGDESTPYVAFDICSNENALSSNNVLIGEVSKDTTNTRLRQNSSATRSAANNTVANPISDGLTRNVVISTGATGNQIYGGQRIGISLANDIIDNGTSTRYWILDSDNSAFLTKDIKLCAPGVPGTRQVRFHSTTDNSIPSAIFRVTGGSAGVGNDATGEFTGTNLATKNVRPSTANTYACGNSTFPWSGGATQVAFTVTSDMREKEQISKLSDYGKVLDAWSEVDWYQYKLKSHVDLYGDSAEYQIGVMAQEILSIFQSHGLNAADYGIVTYESWDEITDPDGVVTPAGDLYTVNYTAAHSLESELQRRNCQKMELKFKELESRITSLEDK